MQKRHGSPLKKVLHIEVQWKKENKQLAVSVKKFYVTKKNRFQRRKNAAFNNINQLLLTCCESGCLFRRGPACNMKALIRDQRNMLYQKTYNEQNCLLEAYESWSHAEW